MTPIPPTLRPPVTPIPPTLRPPVTPIPPTLRPPVTPIPPTLRPPVTPIPPTLRPPVTPTGTALRAKPADIGKPLLRGWLHTYAFFAALAAGAVLCGLAATRPGIAPLLSCVIYTLSICGLFGVSALYHRRVWSARGFALMRRLDHSMIFIFIAGTYTPFSALLLPPERATVILAVVWGGALAGVAMKLAWPHAPRWASAPLYVALGWVAVFVLPDLLRHGGVALLVLLLVGGIAYTLGAVCYALRRPKGWPRYFGHHEFFHASTLLAALAHHVAIYLALYG